MNRNLVAIITAIVLDLMPGTSPHHLWGQNDPVELGKQALDSGIDYPWYDPVTDSLRQIDVKPTTPPMVAMNWERQLNEPEKDSNWSNWDWSVGFAKIFEIFMWLLVVATLSWGLWYLFRSFMVRERTFSREKAVTVHEQLARVTELPFQVSVSDAQTDLLTEARRCYESEKFEEAVIYLFSYQLIQLDKYGWIRLLKGKTNRQYVRELRGEVPLSQLLTDSMLVFEDYFFGNHSVQKDRFEALWRQLHTFHQAVTVAESAD